MIRIFRRALLAGVVAAGLVAVAPSAAQAVANPYRTSGVSAEDDTSPKTATADCTGNDRLIGMGARVDGGGGDVLLTRLVPDLGTDSVEAYAIENVQITTAWDVHVWAICAPAGTEPAGLTLVDGVEGPDEISPKTATAECPQDTLAYSVGYRLGQGSGQVVIDEVRFADDLGTGSVTAYAFNAGSAGAWNLRTYVICGEPPIGGLTLRETESGDNSLTPKTESADVCDGAEHVHGVGGFLDGARGDASITALEPRAQLTTGEATARELGQTNDLWDLTVQTVCGG